MTNAKIQAESDDDEAKLPTVEQVQTIYELARLRRVVQAVSDYYSGSLDHQPFYVKLAREALEKSAI